MILRLPNFPGRTVHMPVAAIDLTKTLLTLAGAATEKTDGVNLLPDLLAEGPVLRGPVYSELHRYVSARKRRTKDIKTVIDYPWKLIADRRRRTLKLFNLDDDPHESKNLVQKERKVARKLRRQLRHFYTRAEKLHPLP